MVLQETLFSIFLHFASDRQKKAKKK